ncbi:MAG: FtsX-like permease family protein [Planctomycetota bacterium]
MRPAWRLAISALSGRRKRVVLLTAAVALSALLVAAVATATHSINASLQARVTATVGNAQARLEPASGQGRLPERLLTEAGSWDGVVAAVGRVRDSIAIERIVEPESGLAAGWSTALALGIDPELEPRVRPIDLAEGRLPEAPDEVVLDELLAARLAGRDPAAGMMAGRAGQVRGVDQPDRSENDASSPGAARVAVGETVRLRRLLGRGEPARVVGIAKQPPLGGRPRVYFTVEGLASATRGKPGVSEIDLLLVDDADPEAFVEAQRQGIVDAYGQGVLIQTSARITSGLEQNLRSSRVGFYVGSIMAFFSAGFIIMTGLTVDVAQRQRELAIVRCVGGTRAHLAGAQLIVGGVIGTLGAVLGIPGGVVVTWALVEMFKENLGAGLAISTAGLVLSAAGSIIAGLLGAAWPAWKAASTSPLRALSPQAQPARTRGIVLTLGLGLAGVAAQIASITLPTTGDGVFWAYLTFGLPALVVGYFLLGVPAVVLVTRLLGPTLDAVLGLPRGVLARTIAAHPYRYGFTTGAMMGGLALMLSIWAQGGSVMRDWLGSLRFPDAFVYGLSLTPDIQDRLDGLDFVEGTAAIAVHPIETDAFGVRGLTNYRSSFIAFEPDTFFELATLRWVEGDEDTARERLNQGGAIIVAREFMVAQGLSVGDTFVCRNALGEDRTEQSFEIVGVVTSPGLDIVSTFFNIGENYTQQALHAVFGTRADLKERFGSDATQLVQIELADDVDDAVALDTIKRELFDTGILEAGSGREIKRELASVISNTLIVSTTIAIGAMVIASFGVANLIVATVESRRYELGVFRAIGAGRASLARLVVGESIVVAIAACGLGFVLSVQGSFAGRALNRVLLGLDLQPFISWTAVAIGFSTVIGVCVFAALPAAIGVLRARPRELLAVR